MRTIVGQRESGIELLRIIAVLMVIFSHLSGYIYPKLGGANLIVTDIFRSFSVCAVDIFVIISGYFLYNSNKRTIGKAAYLVIMMLFVSIGSYLIQIVMGKKIFSGNDFLNYCIPFNYFVTLYVVLYVISPYINVLLKQLSIHRWKIMMLILFIVFSVYNTTIEIAQDIFSKELVGASSIGRLGSQNGYNIVNFMLLYCIGAYLHNLPFKTYNNRRFLLVIIVIACSLIVYLWNWLGEGFVFYSNSARSYHNPVVITMSVSFFLLFKSLQFGSKFINVFAKSVFFAFLLHSHLFSYLKSSFFTQTHPLVFIIWIVGTLLCIYCLSWLMWKFYDVITKPLFNNLNKFVLVSID